MSQRKPFPVHDAHNLSVGLAAIVFPALYVVADLMELQHGGMYTSQLALRSAGFIGMGIACLRARGYEQTAQHP